MDTTAPAVNSPKAANIDQTYASRPKPIGCRVSRPRSERRSAISRKISLPASAQEWAASASIDAEPVIQAATDLATAISRLAPNATSTVSMAETLSSRIPPQALPGSCQVRPSSLPGGTSTMVRRRTNQRRSNDVAASKKTVIALASGVFALGAGIGVAGLASADPTTTPSASPSGAPSAGTDRLRAWSRRTGRSRPFRGRPGREAGREAGRDRGQGHHGAEGDPRRQQA